MNTLADQFHQLTHAEKRSVHLFLGQHALLKWHYYCSSNRRRLFYVESVCGTGQIVDTKLPTDAFDSAREGRDVKGVANRYREPIAAIQDDDLTFPDPIKFTYYSLYNLFIKYAQQEVIDDWLIVNQALSSEQDDAQWPILLETAIQTTKRQ